MSFFTGGEDLDQQAQLERQRKSMDELDAFWIMKPAAVDFPPG